MLAEDRQRTQFAWPTHPRPPRVIRSSRDADTAAVIAATARPLAGIRYRHDVGLPRVEQSPAQGELFAAAELGDTGPDERVGYRGPTACQIAGISYRQLDYWARTSLVVPTLRDAAGSGSVRLYSFADVLVLKVVKRFLDAGVSLQNIRQAVRHLRARGVRELAGVTLFSDGTTIYECHGNDEVVDLLRGGQGMFGIALDATLREITGTVHRFPRDGQPGSPRPLTAPATQPQPADSPAALPGPPGRLPGVATA